MFLGLKLCCRRDSRKGPYHNGMRDHLVRRDAIARCKHSSLGRLKRWCIGLDISYLRQNQAKLGCKWSLRIRQRIVDQEAEFLRVSVGESDLDTSLDVH